MLVLTKRILHGVALVGLAACAQQEETQVGVQPTFDKLGNAYCPTGYVLSGDVCLLPAGAAAPGNATATAMASDDGAGAPGGADTPDTPDDPSTPDDGGNQNQNQQQNTNENRQQTNNRNQGGS